jgi:hypothetical protein
MLVGISAIRTRLCFVELAAGFSRLFPGSSSSSSLMLVLCWLASAPSEPDCGLLNQQQASAGSFQGAAAISQAAAAAAMWHCYASCETAAAAAVCALLFLVFRWRQ